VKKFYGFILAVVLLFSLQAAALGANDGSLAFKPLGSTIWVIAIGMDKG
jgi:hypothetical protein